MEFRLSIRKAMYQSLFFIVPFIGASIDAFGTSSRSIIARWVLVILVSLFGPGLLLLIRAKRRGVPSIILKNGALELPLAGVEPLSTFDIESIQITRDWTATMTIYLSDIGRSKVRPDLLQQICVHLYSTTLSFEKIRIYIAWLEPNSDTLYEEVWKQLPNKIKV